MTVHAPAWEDSALSPLPKVAENPNGEDVKQSTGKIVLFENIGANYPKAAIAKNCNSNSSNSMHGKLMEIQHILQSNARFAEHMDTELSELRAENLRLAGQLKEVKHHNVPRLHEPLTIEGGRTETFQSSKTSPKSWEVGKMSFSSDANSKYANASLGRNSSVASTGSPRSFKPAQTTPTKYDDLVSIFKKSGANLLRRSTTRWGNTHGHQRVFGDAEELKAKIREIVITKQYNVLDYYSNRGICSDIARSRLFEMLCFAMVVLNAIWMSVEIDCNEENSLMDADVIFQLIANIFCLFFVFELVVRFLAFEKKRYAARDLAFLFDGVLVVFIVMETWVVTAYLAITGDENNAQHGRVLGVLRILRVARCLRMARILRELPELLVIIRGIFYAIRAIICVLTLLTVIIYIGAITFRVITDGTDFGRKWFGSIPAGMGTLLVEGTLTRSGGPVHREAWRANPLFSVVYLVFVVIANITMLGVLTGLLVHTVKTTAEVEKEEAEVATIADHMQKLWCDVVAHDVDGDGFLSAEELRRMLDQPDIARRLHSIGVDVVGLVDLSGYIMPGDTTDMRMSFQQFMEMMLELRGKNQAKVRDVVSLKKYIKDAVISAHGKTVDHISGIRDSQVAFLQHALTMPIKEHAEDKNRRGSAAGRGSTAPKGKTCGGAKDVD